MLADLQPVAIDTRSEPGPGPPRGVAARCISLHRARARTRLALALTVASFARIDGPRWLAYASQRDYARGRLGIPWSRFARCRRLGSFVLQCPSLGSALVAGDVSFSVADELTLRTDPQTGARLLPWVIGRTVRQVRTILDGSARLYSESERRTSGFCTTDADDLSERRTSGSRTTDADEPSERRTSGPRTTDADELSERRTSGPRTTDADDRSERRTTLDAAAQTGLERVSFSVPPAVAHYVHQSLELASALLGSDLAESDCVEAVVAEASTEVRVTHSAEEARRRFHVPRYRRRKHDTPVSAPHPEPPRPHFRLGDRRAALVLDRRLRRLISRQARLQADFEDALLELHEDSNVCVQDFARDALDLPRSTLNDYLQRARQRRRGDPIARALADGKLSPVKAQLLHRLRRCHVPVSCLGPWIEQAKGSTVRRLERMIRWARMQGDLDYRAWSLADCPPPTEAQLRTSNQPVHEIASDPQPEWLLKAEQTPQAKVTWVLATETLDLLMQLMAAVESQHRTEKDTPESLPPWWCLLRVFITARREWSVIERQPNTLNKRVLDRDGYRCATPHCSQRRNLQVHHIHYRSAGGRDEEANLITLCAFHHAQNLHRNLMRIRGRVDRGAEDLTFELGLDTNGRPAEIYRGEQTA